MPQFAVGRLVESYNSSAQTWSSYDPMGRITTQWQCTSQNCGKSFWQLSYGYDLIGDATSSTNGVGVSFTYSYDTAAHLTSLASSLDDANHPGTLLSNVAWNAPGAIASDTLGNNLTENFGYDNRLRLTSHEAGTGGSVYNLSLGYAPNGDVLSANDSVNGNWSYTYDDFNRLLTAVATNRGLGCSYVYDRFGKRWQQNASNGSCLTSSLTFDNPGGLPDNRVDGYSYDSAGDLLNDGTHSYTYDAQNRTTSVDAGSTASYVYDANGQRVQRTSAAGTVNYIHDLEGHVVAEVNSAGAWTRGEVYAGGKHLATYSGGASGTTYFIHADWIGTERVRTTTTGAVYESCTSLAFGDGLACSGGDPSPLHFTGKERDPESNLDYFGARYNSSSLGRFMTPDDVVGDGRDLTNPQDLNLYSYTWNNPASLTDPSGHDVLVCVDNDKGGQNCLTLSDEQYANLYKQQNGQQGITLPGGAFPTGNITCNGGQVCGTARYFEPGMQDTSLDLLNLFTGVGGLLKGAATSIVGLVAEEEAPEATTYVIGTMEDLRAPGALTSGETSVASQIPYPPEATPGERWAANSSNLRQIMAEGRPIKDISAPEAGLRPPGVLGPGNEPENELLNAERNLLRNHGWTRAGSYWYPPR